jgi:hypothetical protein
MTQSIYDFIAKTNRGEDWSLQKNRGGFRSSLKSVPSPIRGAEDPLARMP